MAALLAEAVSVALLRHRLGKLWLRRPVVLLILTSVACQGLPAVLLAFPRVAQWDIYRNGVAPEFAGDAVLLLSAGMLAFTISYLLTRPERAVAQACDVLAVARVLDWRPLALACLPLAVLTYQGRGYNNGSFTTGAGAPAGAVLAAQFFVILVALTGFAFVLRHGWFLPVLAAQSLVLAAAGERTPVLADAAALIVLLCMAGLRPKTRHLQVAGAVTVVAVLAITGVRAAQGRALFYASDGLAARVNALAAGAAGLAPAPGQPPLAAQAAVRLDDDAFTAVILQSVHLGQPRLSPAYVPESLLLAVPSALWPSKLSHALNPALMQENSFGLQHVNYLPGVAGMYAGFLSPLWLCVFLAVLGGACGPGERWLLRRRSPARLVMVCGAVTAVFSFEAGLPSVLVDLRAAAVLAGLAWAAARVSRSRRTRTCQTLVKKVA